MKQSLISSLAWSLLIVLYPVKGTHSILNSTLTGVSFAVATVHEQILGRQQLNYMRIPITIALAEEDWQQIVSEDKSKTEISS